MPRRLLIPGMAVALLLPTPVRAAAAVPVLVIDGKGHGHGVGMAQDGAYWMGRQGRSTPQILSQFYPGTTLGQSGGEVRVAVLTGPAGGVVVDFPNGGEVRDVRDGGQSPGFPVRVAPGGSARLRHDGRQYAVEVAGRATAAPAPSGPASSSSGPALGVAAQQPPPTTAPPTTAPPATTSTTTGGLLELPDEPLLPLPSLPVAPLPSVPAPTLPAPTTTTAAPPSTVPGRAASPRGLWAVPAGGGTVGVSVRGSRYRGVVQAVAGDGLRLVNHVDVEQYLRGMGEVRDPGWPAASLRAQAVAARTYALRAMAGGGELCDTQQCQVYLGAQAEYGAMDKAVAATRGQVLMFRRALASTVYSANGGGFSATPEEGFGTPNAGYPYLRPAAYPTNDPGPWSVTVALRDVAARIGYRGRISAVAAKTAGPSGRVLQVTVEGSGGVRTVSGIDFDRALGLRSTMFTVRTGESANAPAAPPAAEGPVQALPGGEAPPVGADAGTPTAGITGAVVAGAAPVARASAAPSAAAKTLLGGVAWLLLVAVAGAGAGMGLGGSGRPSWRPHPEPAAAGAGGAGGASPRPRLRPGRRREGVPAAAADPDAGAG